MRAPADSPTGTRRTGPRAVPAAQQQFATAWPLFAGLGPLGALPTAPRLVRKFSAVVLAGWELTDLTDDCELIASELASNVVRAATDPDGHPRYDADAASGSMTTSPSSS